MPQSQQTLPPRSYRVTWEDYAGASDHTVFFAYSLENAVSILRDLHSLTYAKIAAFTENGQSVDLGELEFRRAPVPEGSIRDQASLSFTTGRGETIRVKVPALSRELPWFSSGRPKVSPVMNFQHLASKRGDTVTRYKGGQRILAKERKKWASSREKQVGTANSGGLGPHSEYAALAPKTSAIPILGTDGISYSFKVSTSESARVKKFKLPRLLQEVRALEQALESTNTALECEGSRLQEALASFDDHLSGLAETERTICNEVAAIESTNSDLSQRLEAIEAEAAASRERSPTLLNEKQVIQATISRNLGKIAHMPECERRPQSRRRSLLKEAAALRFKLDFLRALIPRASKAQRTSAQAAAYRGDSRRLAQSIKAQLARSSECPYCAGPIGNDPCADHIRPVALGGHSSHDNMVYICRACNVRKEALTLTEYIEKYNLDRERIERTLRALGNRF